MSDMSLDNIVCSFCYRPLSVKPIILFKGQTRCGRCYCKKSIVSYANFVLDCIPFSCANRFDGCKELIYPENVLKHEESCLIRTHNCTICSEDVPIYLMLRHFRTLHISAILNENALFLTLTAGMLSAEYAFLYLHNNHLISIHIKLTLTDPKNIRFQPFLIRANPISTEMIKIKIFLYLGKRRTLESKFRPVDTKISGRLDTEHFFELPHNLVKDSSKIFIAFDFKQSVEPTTPTKKYVLKSSSGPYIKKFYQQSWWRKIFLDKEFLETCKIYSVYEHTLWDISEEKYIFPFCVSCKILSRFSEEYNNAVYVFLDDEYHFLCFHCHLYYKKTNKKVKTVTTFKVMPFEIYKKVKYQCIWSCDNFLNCVEIYNHESSCEQQRKLKCECEQQIFIGNFCDHFLRFHHSGDTVDVKSYLNPFSFLYTTAFISKTSYCMIWVLNTLIAVQFKHNKKSTEVSCRCYIDMSLEGKKTFKILIINPEDTKLLGILKASGGKVNTVKSFKVKCFWEFE